MVDTFFSFTDSWLDFMHYHKKKNLVDLNLIKVISDITWMNLMFVYMVNVIGYNYFKRTSHGCVLYDLATCESQVLFTSNIFLCIRGKNTCYLIRKILWLFFLSPGTLFLRAEISLFPGTKDLILKGSNNSGTEVSKCSISFVSSALYRLDRFSSWINH